MNSCKLVRTGSSTPLPRLGQRGKFRFCRAQTLSNLMNYLWKREYKIGSWLWKEPYVSKWPWCFCFLSSTVNLLLVNRSLNRLKHVYSFQREKHWIEFGSYFHKCHWGKSQTSWKPGALKRRREVGLRKEDSGQPKEHKGKTWHCILHSWEWTGRPSWLHEMRVLGCFHLIQSLWWIHVGVHRVEAETENTEKTSDIILVIQVLMIYYFIL